MLKTYCEDLQIEGKEFFYQEKALLTHLWKNFEESNLLDFFQICFIEKFFKLVKLRGWLYINNIKFILSGKLLWQKNSFL